MFFKMFKMNVLQKLLWADAKNNIMVFAFFSIQHIFINLIHFVFVKRLLSWDSILDLTFLVRLGEEVCKKSEFSGNIRSVRSDFFQTYNPLFNFVCTHIITAHTSASHVGDLRLGSSHFLLSRKD